MKLAAVTFAILLPMIAGCEPERPKATSPRTTTTTKKQSAISPDRGDYLSTTMRARDRTQRQLDEVQRVRREQVREAEEFDRPAKR